MQPHYLDRTREVWHTTLFMLAVAVVGRTDGHVLCTARFDSLSPRPSLLACPRFSSLFLTLPHGPTVLKVIVVFS